MSDNVNNATFDPSENLWDEITKLITEKMPNQLLPLIEEVFHKKYPAGTSIKLLRTEHIVPAMEESRHMKNIFTDITILVQEKDVYHIECQMDMDNEIVIRLIEYDFHIAMTHNHFIDKDGIYNLVFPQSVIMYPGTSASIEDTLKCRVIFPDKSTHEYSVPVVRVQSYNLEQIKEKHLTLFVPFMLIQFQKRLQSKHSPILPNELTDFTKELIVILKNEVNLGNLNTTQYRDYLKMINMAAVRIFNQAVEQQKEVLTVTKSILELPMDEIDELFLKIEKAEAVLADKDAVIADKDSVIADKDAEITKLKQLLSDHNISYT